ncbi:MAG: cytochrome c biogenesis protein ResB [Vicinamibacterales bacterium]
MATPQNPELGLPAESLPSQAKQTSKPSLLDRALKQLSSVRFGVTLLILLIILSMTGMLIMQVNVEGFDKYYATLTPSQKWLYTDPILRAVRNMTGWRLQGRNLLSLVDIYKSDVFMALLAVLTLNIILASIDHFPGAWRYITRKKLTATRPYVLHQAQHATVDGDGSADEPSRIAALCAYLGYRPTITHEANRTTIFAERGAWNRLGAYFVHVGLLVIFLAGFLTSRSSQTGSMTLQPGSEATTIQGLLYDLNQVQVGEFSLPFTVECTDIQQTLIRPEGSLDASNTVDWFTRIRIEDPATGKELNADVHMNKPVDYRGYRFFQSSYQNVAKARTVTIQIARDGQQPETVELRLNQPATLADGRTLVFKNFTGNEPDANNATDYEKPAAAMQVTAPGGGAPQSFIVRADDSPVDTAGAAALGGTATP